MIDAWRWNRELMGPSLHERGWRLRRSKALREIVGRWSTEGAYALRRSKTIVHVTATMAFESLNAGTWLSA